METDEQTQIIELRELIELLSAQNQQLLLENERLKLKIIELEDKLNKNSSNSGLPTSKDVYRIEKSRPKSDKKAGGELLSNFVYGIN